MKRLPKFLKQYFQDVDFKRMNLKKHRVDIIRRILNYGNEKAVAWMRKNFKESQIQNVLSNFRGYSKKSANYWALILGVPKEKLLCLKTRSLRGPKPIWPY